MHMFLDCSFPPYLDLLDMRKLFPGAFQDLISGMCLKSAFCQYTNFWLDTDFWLHTHFYQDADGCLDARIPENYTSSQANLSRHPGRRIYPGQVRRACAGYNPPVRFEPVSNQFGLQSSWLSNRSAWSVKHVLQIEFATIGIAGYLHVYMCARAFCLWTDLHDWSTWIDLHSWMWIQ